MANEAAIRPYLRQAYLFGLMMMAVGLTLSPFLMTLAQFWLVLVWLADALVPARHCGLDPQSPKGTGFKPKLSRFWHNKAAVLLVAFYLMHVVGLLWTSDFQYALKDLRVKLPILVLPFVMSGMEPLDRKRFDWVMLVYVLSVFVATLFSFSAYLRHDYEDVREISRFISHIRFCLHIVFCIAIIGNCLFTRRAPLWSKTMQFFLMLWLVYQVFIFESLSGYVILAAVVFVSVVYAFLQWQKGRGWRIAVGFLALVAVAVVALVAVREVKPFLKVDPVDFSTLEKKTALGNDYWHDTVYTPVEDGKYVGLYYCKPEMEAAWSQRSSLPFDGTTANGENLEATIARYLTSKDLRKDAQGMAVLTDEDIRNIEQGVANYNNWKHPGLRARLSSTLFEYNLYRKFNNPNGGSLSQRIEFTRAAFHIIKDHWLFGVGTGDVPLAFRSAYDEIRSPLAEEFRFRAHNQYLSVFIAFGIVGLALFLLMSLFPFLSSRTNRTYLYTVFLCVMLLSMFPEDTLETQAGATMFAFFECFLLFASPKD
ncbi:MAG: O-antigen ligase family protein [Bacteroidales bacterium]|nr:O-antigen ligase family protein [Bacteroidales bacterium]